MVELPSEQIAVLRRPPSKTYSLRDLGIDQQERQAPCKFGVAEPFPFLSTAGVDALLKEIASESVQQSCKFSTDRTPWCEHLHTLDLLGDGMPGHKFLWQLHAVTSSLRQCVGQSAILPGMKVMLNSVVCCLLFFSCLVFFFSFLVSSVMRLAALAVASEEQQTTPAS